MNYKCILPVCLASLALTACKTEQPAASNAATAEVRMKEIQLEATVQQKLTYEHLPSASGIELVDSAYYVVGDDSPYLYELDAQYKLAQRHVLFDTADFATGRIPKPLKPDLEAMAHFTYGRDQMLLLIGSGSSDRRNRAFVVNVTDGMQVRELDFTRLYMFLKRVLRMKTDSELNLEGFAMDETDTYIMQRALGTAAGVLFRFPTRGFKDFVMGEGDIPAAAVYHFALPELGGYMAGFSGAYAFGGKLFFTASVENTPNAIEDGEVLGSLVGLIELNALPYAADATNPLRVPAVQLMNPDGSVYTGKAESLVVAAGEGGAYKLVVVSDDDQGGSELLEIQLEVKE
ncbi:DUF6929 family protein [Pontibacter russatus]|uniref:DUF6929 family protein n=1 Tax=Pontibacter russatus TaxID=2694929 RepID=UPI001F29ECE8|nr:hypothetical protein [Pontibacter russatus]